MRHQLAGLCVFPTLLTVAIMTTTSADGSKTTFAKDLEFLRAHKGVIVLRDASGAAQVAVVPAWQGRVMTSTSGGSDGRSYGWINRELIASKTTQPHFNPFGGEDRFWLGPEGGQFSIFFAKGAKFEFADWQTPAALDTMAYDVVAQAADHVTFGARFQLANYSGTRFDVQVRRNVRLLSPDATWSALGVSSRAGVRVVGFETENRITNAGTQAWRKEGGLLSVWILGMFNPAPTTTIVVPIKAGSEPELGPALTSDYFGQVPPERLVVRDGVAFFSADGKFRSKIGVSPRRSRGVLGSYDADGKVLTIVQFTQPSGVTEYVNSLWKLQEDPYSGDAANSYNDGPTAPGEKPLGPFYELESSSPAAALEPGSSLTHVHRTVHLTGAESDLDAVARAVLGVSLEEIQGALRR